MLKYVGTDQFPFQKYLRFQTLKIGFPFETVFFDKGHKIVNIQTFEYTLTKIYNCWSWIIYNFWKQFSKNTHIWGMCFQIGLKQSQYVCTLHLAQDILTEWCSEVTFYAFLSIRYEQHFQKPTVFETLYAFLPIRFEMFVTIVLLQNLPNSIYNSL